MEPPKSNLDFWVAVFVALLVKIKSSRQFSWWETSSSILVGIGCAWIGHEWVAATTPLSSPIAAAILALAGEGVMRWVLLVLKDPKQIIDLWKYYKD